MKAQDFRIGNLAHDKDGNVIKIESISEDGINLYVDSYGIMCREYFIDDLKPIHLTEEWLQKFGFHQNINENHVCDISIDYVHQLQNIYFYETGEELILK